MQPTALQGLTIVEYARGVSGPYCAKLLADMGAEVIKIEEPLEGDPARRLGPYPGDLPDAEKSGLFLYLNTNKLSVTLNLADPAGYDLFLELIATADIFVHDRQPVEAANLAIDYETLRAHYPRLIVTAVTPYGSTGPYADYKGHNLNLCQAGGEGVCLPGGMGFDEFPERPPLKLAGHAGDYDGGSAAAVGTMAAVMAREIWGDGQLVDASRQEANLALNRVLFVTHESEGKVTRRANRRYPFGGLFRAKDGYVVLRPTENNHWRAFAGLMGRPELAADPRYKDRGDRIENGAEVNAILDEWARTLTKQEIFDACRDVGCPVAPFADAEEIATSPQLEERGFFQEIDHPQAGRFYYPTAPYRMSETPWSARRPAPLLGQHNADVLSGRLGLSGEELARLRVARII